MVVRNVSDRVIDHIVHVCNLIVCICDRTGMHMRSYDGLCDHALCHDCTF